MHFANGIVALEGSMQSRVDLVLVKDSAATK
jgi:hypothetical protein